MKSKKARKKFEVLTEKFAPTYTLIIKGTKFGMTHSEMEALREEIRYAVSDVVSDMEDYMATWYKEEGEL